MAKKKSEKEAKVKKQSAKQAVKKAAALHEAAAFAEVKEAKKRGEKPKAAAPGKAAISGDDIALRAYFIAERRGKMGWHGDSTGDWVEAERQLQAEAVRKK
ncbi:MAG: DUF2934 domain-containing protein [Verrucomicrobiota bacterium]